MAAERRRSRAQSLHDAVRNFRELSVHDYGVANDGDDFAQQGGDETSSLDRHKSGGALRRVSSGVGDGAADEGHALLNPENNSWMYQWIAAANGISLAS